MEISEERRVARGSEVEVLLMTVSTSRRGVVVVVAVVGGVGSVDLVVVVVRFRATKEEDGQPNRYMPTGQGKLPRGRIIVISLMRAKATSYQRCVRASRRCLVKEKRTTTLHTA